jgi:hypothetical protein
MEHFLEEICKEFPLINARELLHQLRTQGAASIEASGSASRWACVKAALALSVNVRTNGAFEELSPLVWAYFKNAYTTLPELMLQGNDPEVIKALVLMIVFWWKFSRYANHFTSPINCPQTITGSELWFVPGKSKREPQRRGDRKRTADLVGGICFGRRGLSLL